jgi:ferredoxin
MATLSDRLSDNAPGAYYVDSTCIDCAQCQDSAPALFGRNADACLAYVKKQPSTTEEIASAEEALGLCPNQAIGNDGA